MRPLDRLASAFVGAATTTATLAHALTHAIRKENK